MNAEWRKSTGAHLQSLTGCSRQAWETNTDSVTFVPFTRQLILSAIRPWELLD